MFGRYFKNPTHTVINTLTLQKPQMSIPLQLCVSAQMMLSQHNRMSPALLMTSTESHLSHMHATEHACCHLPSIFVHVG